MKILKYCFAIVLIILCFTGLALSCSGDKAEQVNLKAQIQTEASQFDSLIDDFVLYTGGIQDPCDISIRQLFSDTWLFEIYKSGTNNKGMLALAVPVPKNIIRGLTYVKITDTTAYLTRGGVMEPNTNIYMTSTWNGSPYDWGTLQGPSSEQRRYPLAVSDEYFKSYKLMTQLYMVPPEASHGVYTFSWNVTNCSMINASRLVSNLKKENPYIDIDAGKATDNTSYLAAIELINAEIKKSEEDTKAYLSTIILLNNNFFSKPAFEYDKNDAVQELTSKLADVKKKLSGTGSYVSKLKGWDFTNAIKYGQAKKK